MGALFPVSSGSLRAFHNSLRKSVFFFAHLLLTRPTCSTSWTIPFFPSLHPLSEPLFLARGPAGTNPGCLGVRGEVSQRHHWVDALRQTDAPFATAGWPVDSNLGPFGCKYYVDSNVICVSVLYVVGQTETDTNHLHVLLIAYSRTHFSVALRVDLSVSKICCYTISLFNCDHCY